MTTTMRSAVVGEMPLLDHLNELRTRLFKAALALALGAVVGYILFPQALELLTAPYCQVPTAFRPETDGECTLIATKVLEGFSVRIKTSLVIGLFVGGPVIFYQLWRFITPGLTEHERRYALPFVFLSQLFFACGMLFAYLVIPQGLRVLLTIAGEGITPLLQAGEYLSFFLTMSVAFGLTFELPLLLIFLSLVGVVGSQGLRRVRPYALVGAAILAAMVTPTTDPVTMLLMMLPLTVFYEISIMSAWLIERRRARVAATHRAGAES